MKTIPRLTRLAAGFNAVLMCASALAGQPNICQPKHTQGAAGIVQPKSSLHTLEEVLLRQIGQGKVCVDPASRYSQIKFDPKYFQETILGNSLIAQISGALSPQGIQQQPKNLELQKHASRSLLNLPIHFEATADKSHYRARGVGYDLVLNGSEVLVQVRAKNPENDEQEQIKLRLTSPGAKPGSPVGEAQIPGKVNYLIGKDQSQWKTDISLYQKVRYQNVYEGIDRVFYGKQGELEYDWIVAPGSDPSAIRERIEEADDLFIDSNGDLVIKSGVSTMRHLRPVAYQDIEGERVSVSANYKLSMNGEIQFEIGKYDKTKSLVIDPILSYGALLPLNALNLIGTGGVVTSAAVDTAGNLYITGYMLPNSFINQTSSLPAGGGFPDSFVIKLNSGGSAIEYATYLGGNQADFAHAIAVDSSGNAVIVGATSSGRNGSFPTLNAIEATTDLSGTVFITKLNPAGNGFVFSTLLGSSGGIGTTGGLSNSAASVTLDNSANIYVTGELSVGTVFGEVAFFPVTPGAYSELGKSFVTKLSPSGNIIYSTRLPGTNGGRSIAVDRDGNAYIHGAVRSYGLPLVNPAQSDIGEIVDGYITETTFIAKFNSTGSALLYSTYLGGSQYPAGQYHTNGPQGIAVDSSGRAWVTGVTGASDFPLAPVGNILFNYRPTVYNDTIPINAIQTYVARMSPDGGSVEALVWLSGTSCRSQCSPVETRSGGIAIDSADNVYVGGGTLASGPTDFPQVNAIPLSDTTATTLGFVTKILPSGQGLSYSTLISANHLTDSPNFSLAVSSGGDAYLLGNADYAFQPTPGAYLADAQEISHPFVSKIISGNTASVSISSSKNPETVGNSITLTALVTGNTPSGSVTFLNGGNSIGVAQLNVNGTASIVVPLLDVGAHRISARYSGDANNLATESSVLTQNINPIPAATSTTLSASATGIPLNGTLQLTANVSGSNRPSGTVLFKNGATVLGTAVLGASQANLSLNSGALAAGVHAIVAEYQGDAFNFASSSSPVSITVAAPPTIAVATPSQGSTILSTDPISYSIIAAPNGLATISSVVLRVNGQIIATLTVPPYTLSLAQAPPGSFTVDAIATDSYGQTSQSAPITYTVRQNGPVTTYLHQDLTGNTIAATDVNGNLLYTEQYRPYGERLENAATSQATQPLGNRIWFHGKVQDEATGLQYFGARYYDPVIGRFMGVDAVGFDEGNIHSFNRFAYGNNNPYRYRDPDGNSASDIFEGTDYGSGPVDVPNFLTPRGEVAVGIAASLIPPVRAAQTVGNIASGNIGEVVTGLIPGAKVGGGVKGVAKYEVGKFDDLAKRSVKGDGLDIHHAVQKNPAGQAISGYDPSTAPSIAIPRGEHSRIPTQKGKYSGSARDLLAKDVKDLRNRTNAPNSALQDLVKQNKETYPGAFSK